ncbi:MAG: alpha/beta hydrolase-fold protein [Bacteroidia bacterium]|nr:alpha/beta hydrolase-fold protein [Bacteroidia bacterium]
MKKLSFLLICAMLPLLLVAQGSKVFDNLTLPSKILNGERKYAIYLPPDYETSQRSYPVLYLLHGGGDDQTGWVQFGEVQHITDKSLREGTATPMIIVMPDANTGRRGYFNDVRGDWRYEDFFFQEFIPYIEKTYRIKSEKRFRAVAGLSMGGGGSFMYALHHPEMFSSACPLSAATGPINLDDTNRYFGFAGITNPTVEQKQAYYDQYSALALIEKMKDEDKKAVRWYIDCGDDDFLYEGNALVHIAMKKKEIPHEYRVRNGAHSWTYWRDALPTVLSFVSDAFHQY